jgi:hypothetical protein
MSHKACCCAGCVAAGIAEASSIAMHPLAMKMSLNIDLRGTVVIVIPQSGNWQCPL